MPECRQAPAAAVNTVPAISLWQPWASLWLSTRKVHETRGWATHYRGPLVVHAAQRRPDIQTFGTLLYELCCIEFGYKWTAELPRGALLGVVQLIDCRSTTERRPTDHEDFLCGDWGADRFAWQRGAFDRWAAPVPYRGRQRFFNVAKELLEEAA
jgi:activating signal cointegrator 1